MHKYVTRQNPMFLHRLSRSSGTATDLKKTDGQDGLKISGHDHVGADIYKRIKPVRYLEQSGK